MIEPEGSAEAAAQARAQLDRAPENRAVLTALGAGLYDDVHGQLQSAADAYVLGLSAAAQQPNTPETHLAAWFFARRLLAMRNYVPGVWKKHEVRVLSLLSSPGHLGWRAVADLQEWANAESLRSADVSAESYDAQITSRMGCATSVRLAGPFGHGLLSERRQHFEAEQAPWPKSWPRDPMQSTSPHVLATRRVRCAIASTEPSDPGVYYAETFFETPSPRDLIIAVPGATAVWVDDELMVARDTRVWGVWQRAGAAAHIEKGRHRIVARMLDASASIRLLNLDGTSAGLLSDTDGNKPYAHKAARPLANPNPIDSRVTEIATAGSKATSDANDPNASAIKDALFTFLAAFAASCDGLNDVANVLMQPLVTPSKTPAPIALLMAAQYALEDPAYPEQMRRTNGQELLAKASAADSKLWYPRSRIISNDASQRGLHEALAPLKQLIAEFPDVAPLRVQLTRLYGQLGWRAERLRSAKELADAFPANREALNTYIDALDDDGSVTEADAVAAKLRTLAPDSDIEVGRAIARRDWPAAIAELRRLERIRPDSKDIASRIADVLAHSGNPSAAAEQLQKALETNPTDASARLRLADRAYSLGDTSALRRALSEALQAGSNTNEIREAIDLIEGASLLKPYRIDGRRVIADYRATEKSRKDQVEGTATRILDYSAVWVHPDGSSEMLEHEIMKIQSQEAIDKEAEQPQGNGLLLTLRVIKPDGTILEPEPVAGKPTLTMPHLEIGDCIETERILFGARADRAGSVYRGPHWFFREADKGYWRSEFVVITPKSKQIDIETIGQVPNPTVTEQGDVTERRWRIDQSPPAPEEPNSPNPREFLPSVRVGWGVNLTRSLTRYINGADTESAIDPRVRELARTIANTARAASREDQARAIYRWVNDTIQDGRETDGRRVVLGRSGVRHAAFTTLARALSIPCELALVKNRLASDSKGPMSELDAFDNLVVRWQSENNAHWLSLENKFTPFGYLPANLRNQPAIRLIASTPRDVTPSLGDADSTFIDGEASLHPDGSADITVTQRYVGRMAIGLRSLFSRIAESKRHEFVETRILAATIPGAKLEKVTFNNSADPAAPFEIVMHANALQLARVIDSKAVLKSIFPIHLTELAALPSRQTPLLLDSPSYADIRFTIRIGGTFKLPTTLQSAEFRDDDRVVTIDDRAQGQALVLHRSVTVPAARIQPGDPYARFAAFTQRATAALEQEIVLGR